MSAAVGKKSTPGGLPPLRVMVVDDSLVMRGAMTRIVNEDSDVAEVVASARDGQKAIERARAGDIDVVILDIEMPVLDGISTLPHLLSIDPELVIIMASTLTTRNAQISLQALEAGAKDYVPKPSAITVGAGVDEFKRELVEKVKILGLRYRRTENRSRPATKSNESAAVSPPNGKSLDQGATLRAVAPVRHFALAIGSSTGGPNALSQVLKDIPSPMRIPVFLTQHMPPTFTSLLAKNLTQETGHKCHEAQDGEAVLPGHVYIAPGDYHMVPVRENGSVLIKLSQGEKENFCRPAVDPMLRALIDVYGKNVLAVILTGMGQDGLRGAEALVRASGNVMAQDEESSTVWGMPGAVAKAGLCCDVTSLNRIGKRISELVG